MSAWNYPLAVRHLLSFVNFETLPGRRMVRRPIDLERFARALGRLGHPERCAPALHVAGTNGKGSTAATAAALLTAHGLRTSLYSSPHLVDFTERIRIDGRPIGRGDFAALAEEVAGALGGEAGTGFQTTFEHLTAMAFLAALRHRVDAQVVEVGMGGRLDSTNVIHPRVSVITALSLDHREVLGETIGEIAREKAGIVKRGVPVVVGRQPFAAALGSIRQRARRLAAPLDLLEGVRICDARPTPRGEMLTLVTPHATYPDLRLRLRGAHQLDNAALAVRAVEHFLDRGLDPGQVRAALARVSWPGRFDVLSQAPPLVLDGAHNPDGARRLAESLARYYPGRGVAFVLGVSEGKDLAGIVDALAPRAIAVVVVAASHARAADPEEVAGRVRRRLNVPVESARDLIPAIIRARRLAGDGGVTCVAGSLYLVGDVRGLWPRFRGPWAGREAGPGAARAGVGLARVPAPPKAKRRGR